jgi:ABC-2 type transport system permease protein
MSAGDVTLADGGPPPRGDMTLREVRGPAAIEGNPRRFLHLTWVIARTDYKLTYFGSILGYLWSFMQPLLFFGVLYLVFAVVLTNFSKGIMDYPVLLLMNIVLFSFFQQATTNSITSLVARESLVRKMQFPRLVIPMATVTTLSINLLFNTIVVIAFMVAYGVSPRPTWLLMPVILVMLFILVTGISMLLSALYVRYRDISPIWAVISQALYFACPVFITINSILPHGPTVVRLYLFNPMAFILQQARHWMIGGPVGGRSPAALMGGAVWVLVPLALLFGIWVLGFLVFRRRAPQIAEEL